MHSAKNSAPSRQPASPGDNSVPRTETACVATMPRSQAPLMPVSSDGFVSRITAAVKNAYITTTHNAIPAIHST